MTDVAGLVEKFGDAHPMVRRTIVKGAPDGLIDGLQICNRVTHLGGDVSPFPGRAKRVFFSLSPHRVVYTTRACVKKPNSKWCIVHAYNKLNAATIHAQTPIPRKDVLQNNMVVVLCIAHSTWSMDIINCSCERVIFCLQQ